MARDAQLVEDDDGVMAFVVSGRRDPTEQRHDLRKLRDSGVDTREVVRRIVDDHGEDQLVENDRHDFESHDDRPHPLTTVDATVTPATSLTAHNARSRAVWRAEALHIGDGSAWCRRVYRAVEPSFMDER